MAERRMYDCSIHYNYHDGLDSERDSDHCLSENFLDTLRRKLLDLDLTDLNFQNLKLGTSVMAAHTEDFINNCYKNVLVLTEGFTKSHKHTYFAQIGMEDKISKGETKDVLALAVGIGKDQCKKYGLSILKILYFEKDESTWEGAEKQWASIAQFFKDLTDQRGKPSRDYERIVIEDDSIGHSYEELFGDYFHDSNIEIVNIEDAYIRNSKQVDNFERLCELVKMKKASGLCNVKDIKLVTVRSTSSLEQRTEQIRESLSENDISLEIECDKNLHDRQISFNTRPVIMLGRGLDIYKTDEDDQNLRKYFPRVIGCVDGTHINIATPSENEADYVNRKGQHSLNVQMVCDHRFRIRSVTANWPGSVHDSRIWRECALSQQFENDVHEGFILGDSGYPCTRYLLTPFLSPANRPETRYNSSLCRTRVLIEQTFGFLKRRFPILRYGIRSSPERCVIYTVACVILHNIGIEKGDVLISDEELEICDHVQQDQQIPCRGDGIAMRRHITNTFFA